eukprot:6723862-Prymnesium_polylepis.1
MQGRRSGSNMRVEGRGSSLSNGTEPHADIRDHLSKSLLDDANLVCANSEVGNLSAAAQGEAPPVQF